MVSQHHRLPLHLLEGRVSLGNQPVPLVQCLVSQLAPQLHLLEGLEALDHQGDLHLQRHHLVQVSGRQLQEQGLVGLDKHHQQLQGLEDLVRAPPLDKHPGILKYYQFVLFVLLLYLPSQQLWSWRDGKFTYPLFFLGKLEQAINQYFVHILSLVTDNNPS